jgi:transposase-like protein
MRGLTVTQTAYILGVHPNAVRKWRTEPPNEQAIKTMQLFYLLSPVMRKSLKNYARKLCPNKGGRVY